MLLSNYYLNFSALLNFKGVYTSTHFQSLAYSYLPILHMGKLHSNFLYKGIYLPTRFWVMENLIAVPILLIITFSKKHREKRFSKRKMIMICTLTWGSKCNITFWGKNTGYKNTWSSPGRVGAFPLHQKVVVNPCSGSPRGKDGCFSLVGISLSLLPLSRSNQ